MDVSHNVLLVCQPLCFIGLYFSQQPNSFREIILILLTFPSYQACCVTWHAISCPQSVSSWHLIFSSCFKKLLYSTKYLWWIAEKKFYDRLIKSESLWKNRHREYWCNLTLIIMDCEWIGEFFIISLNISWGLLGAGRPCNFAITEHKIWNPEI